VKTIACKFLDYDENNKVESCNISQMSGGEFVWERIDVDGFVQLCQFCTKRGRLNSPTACTSEDRAMCSEYEESEVIIKLRDRGGE